MQYRYAKIKKQSDGYGYVECESYLSGQVVSETMIPVGEYFDLSGKRWNYENESWESYTPPEPEPPQPTQLDNIETTQLLIMEAMADQYEQRLETDLMMMDAQATTFEAVLALTEGVV